jgi:hypothetical protein
MPEYSKGKERKKKITTHARMHMAANVNCWVGCLAYVNGFDEHESLKVPEKVGRVVETTRGLEHTHTIIAHERIPAGSLKKNVNIAWCNCTTLQ